MEEKKRSAGRPKIVWDKKQWKIFERLCKIQCPQTEICAVMDVTDKTLLRLVREHYEKDFSEVYDIKRTAGKASLRRLQFQHAKKSPYVAMRLGEIYLGQKQEQESKPADLPTIVINLPPDGEPNGRD